MLKYRKDWLIFLIITMVCCLVMCFMPFTFEFDFPNYHLYIPWAFLNNRIDVDFMAANFRSYFNPILYIPSFYIIKNFNFFPYLLKLLNGFYYSLLIFMTYKIVDLVVQTKIIKKVFIIFLSIILLAFCPVTASVMNCAGIDIQVSIAVLLGFYFVMKNVFDENSKKRSISFFVAGTVLGAITGLKLTAFLFFASILLTIFVFFKKIDNPLKIILYFLIGSAFGFLLTGGYWYYKVFSYFDNPFFPYWNNIFHSQYTDLNAVLNEDFAHIMPHTITQFLFYPFWDVEKQISHGLGYLYFDLKFIFIQVMVTILFLVPILAKLFTKKDFKVCGFIENKKLYFILCFIVFSYYINMLFFAQYRYIVAIIAFFGIVYAAFADMISSRLKTQKEAYFYTLTICLTLVSLNAHYVVREYFDERNNFNSEIVTVSDMKIEDDATVIIATEKVSFVIPYQNKNAKYVFWVSPQEAFKISKYKKFYYYKSEYSEKLMKNIFEQKPKNLYIILNNIIDINNHDLYVNTLNYYASPKEAYMKNCKPIKNNLEKVILCKVQIK